jgi:hypothetical protein
MNNIKSYMLTGTSPFHGKYHGYFEDDKRRVHITGISLLRICTKLYIAV